MTKVNALNWLSEEAKEAEVFLSDGTFNLVCFSHPFKGNVGSIIDQLLYTFNAKKIYKLNLERIFLVENEKGTFIHKLIGEVINKDKNRVKVGEFILELDSSLPGDVQNGNYISFICERIDIYYT